MNPEPSRTQAQERIDSALGKLLRNFNLLELNLGLCIRHLQHPGEVEKSHPFLARSSILEKVARFAKLVQERGLAVETEALEAWCRSVDETPSLRNFYVHGTWEYLPLRKDHPLSFRLPPWRPESLKGSSYPEMTLEDLEDDANSVEAILDEFLRLRENYGV